MTSDTPEALKVDLRARFGTVYRIGWDESRVGLERDPQLMTLRGRRGHVYVDGDDLCMACDNPRLLRRSRAEIEGFELLQDGDDGFNARFPADQLPAVAKILYLYRRRKISPEQRARNTERLARWRQNRKTPA